MKDSALQPKKTPRSRSPESRQDDSWARLQRIYRETRSVYAEPDRRWVVNQDDEQIGSEYWLG
jgi:hypothetical protein